MSTARRVFKLSASRSCFPCQSPFPAFQTHSVSTRAGPLLIPKPQRFFRPPCFCTRCFPFPDALGSLEDNFKSLLLCDAFPESCQEHQVLSSLYLSFSLAGLCASHLCFCTMEGLLLKSDSRLLHWPPFLVSQLPPSLHFSPWFQCCHSSQPTA